jgi:hypothetical protein
LKLDFRLLDNTLRQVRGHRSHSAITATTKRPKVGVGRVDDFDRGAVEIDFFASTELGDETDDLLVVVILALFDAEDQLDLPSVGGD